ncbi:hypothetical protein L1049_003419 [Liquidambar formosana]|uniref:Uncharacterized protein n=1 Tax=Liquidambar formosana TaxID=63359 RepID=A0AAP0N462_LIQFO
MKEGAEDFWNEDDGLLKSPPPFTVEKSTDVELPRRRVGLGWVEIFFFFFQAPGIMEREHIRDNVPEMKLCVDALTVLQEMQIKNLGISPAQRAEEGRLEIARSRESPLAVGRIDPERFRLPSCICLTALTVALYIVSSSNFPTTAGLICLNF